MMAFCGTLTIFSCNTADKAETKSPPVSFPPQESYYETNPIDPEAELINTSNGRVVRTSPDTLQINLENGEKVILIDEGKYTDHPYEYVYKGFEENSGHHLIDLQIHEDYGVLYVNAQDGTTQRLPGLPVYNPSKYMFVCYGGGGPLLEINVDIVSIEALQMKNVFSEAPGWWTIQNASWENDSTISLDVGIYAGDDDSGMEKIINDKAKIQLVDGEWQIIQPELFMKMQNAEE